MNRTGEGIVSFFDWWLLLLSQWWP